MADSGGNVKVILLGDASVGKTHLATRFTRGTLPQTAAATIGLEFSSTDVEIEPGVCLHVQIWDTAGQERYKSVTATHYRRARAALLVYDITNLDSFLNTSKWASEMKAVAEPDIVVCLVGNKADLESSRKVETAKAEQFAKKNDFLFIETSSVTGQNVRDAFLMLLRQMHKVSIKNATSMASAGPGVSWVGRTDRQRYIQNCNNELKGGLKLSDGPAGRKNISCCGEEEDE